MSESSAIFRLLPPVSPRQSLGFRYGGAILLSLAFIGIRWLLGFYIGHDAPFVILYVPIALSAFYGGLGPGLAAVLTSVALADYFLIPPLYTLGLPDARAVVTNLLFAVSGLVVSVLGEVGRNAMLQASNEAEIRIATRRQLQGNEERFRITEQAVAGGVWDWDMAQDTLYWSDGYLRMHDYPLNTKPSYELWAKSIYRDDHDRILTLMKELPERKLHNWATEYRIVTENGRTRWVSSHGRIFYDDHGKPKRMVGINIDITARRRAEETARSNEAKLRLLMQNARVGVWEWNPQDGSVRCTPEFYEVLGVDPAVPPTFDRLMAFVHPVDNARIRELLMQLQHHPGQDFDFENRYIASDGVERVLHTRGTVVQDENGSTARLVGITIDLVRSNKEMLTA